MTISHKRKDRSPGPAPSLGTVAAPRGLPLWLAVLAIIATGLGAYCNSFQCAFVFDDHRCILDDPSIRHWWPPSETFLAPQNITRPLVALSLMINYHISGPEVWSYHVVNLAVHLLAALVLFGIIRRTLRSPGLSARFGVYANALALSATLLWVVHPLQTESVTYVIQRAEALMALFYLLAMYCAIRGMNGREGETAASGARPSAPLPPCSLSPLLWYAAAVAACILGAGCKQVIATAPLLILLYDRTFVSGTFGAALRRRWGLYAGLAASWALLAWLCLASPPMTSAGFGVKRLTPAIYLLTQGGVILHYLRLCFWPDPLIMDYGWHTAEGIEPATLAVGALLMATLWALWRRPRLGFLGAAFFLILAPSSSFIPIIDVAFEHRMYLPLAAVILAVVLGVYLCAARWTGGWPKRARQLAACGLLLVLLGACITLTLRRNSVYRDEIIFWQDLIAKWPCTERPHRHLADELAHAGRWDEALAAYENALAIHPRYADALAGRGRALEELHRLDDAVASYQRSLEVEDDAPEVHNNLGEVLTRQKRWAEAEKEFAAAVALRPQSFDFRRNLCLALLSQDKLAEAQWHYEELIRVAPADEIRHDLADALRRHGAALDGAKKHAEAIAAYQKALRLLPALTTYNDLGVAYSELGQTDEAIECFLSALRLGQNADTHFNLGLMYEHKQDLASAIDQYTQALKLKPDFPFARANLQRLQAQRAPK